MDKKELTVIKSQVTKTKNIVAGIGEIKSQEDYDLVGKKYIDIKKIAKEFDQSKKRLTKPLNELRNEIFSYTRPIEAQFKQAFDQLDKLLRDWEIKVESERQKEAEKIEAQVDSGEVDLATATNAVSNLESVDQVSTDKGKIHQRIIYDLVIDDENKIEREFLTPDLPKIKQHYQATGLVPKGFKLEQRVIRSTRLN